MFALMRELLVQQQMTNVKSADIAKAFCGLFLGG